MGDIGGTYRVDSVEAEGEVGELVEGETIAGETRDLE